MGIAPDHTEIVDLPAGIFFFYEPLHFLPEPVQFRIVRDDGIHMDGRLAHEAFVQLSFDIVDHVMGFQYIGFVRNFRVKGDETAARPVIVDDHVVDAQHAFMAHDGLIDILYQFR